MMIPVNHFCPSWPPLPKTTWNCRAHKTSVISLLWGFNCFSTSSIMQNTFWLIKKNNNTSGILLAKLERRPVANMTIFDDAYNIYLFVDESCRTCGFSKKKKKVIASNIKWCDKTKAVICGDTDIVFCINLLASWYAWWPFSAGRRLR